MERVVFFNFQPRRFREEYQIPRSPDDSEGYYLEWAISVVSNTVCIRYLTTTYLAILHTVVRKFVKFLRESGLRVDIR
jgi:hypothetical protein